MTNINKQYLAKEIPLTETVFGHTIQDNYRYFEDIKNPDFLDWVQKQSKITRAFLDGKNTSKKIYDEFLAIDKEQKEVYFFIRNMKEHIYYMKRLSSEMKGKLYRTNNTSKKEEFLFDFDSLKEKYGGEVEMQAYNVSPNEKYISFALGVGGSESGFTHFLNLETLQLDKLCIAKTRSFGAFWLTDKDFIYVNFPNIDATDGTSFTDLELRYNSIGKDNSANILVLSESNNTEINDLGDSNWYIPTYDFINKKLYVHHVRETEAVESLYVAKFDIEKLKKGIIFKKIFGFEEKIKNTMIFNDTIFYLTNKFRDNFEFRKARIEKFNNKKSIEICGSKEEVIDGLYRDKHALYCITLKEAHKRLYKYNFNSDSLVAIETESLGSIGMSWEEDIEEQLFNLTNFKTPLKYFRIDENNQAVEHEIVNFKNNLNLDDIVIKVEEYISHDGVKIPITFAHKKGLEKNGKNRCLIHAYGAYGMTSLPFYSREKYRWINNGGIIAIAHVRGGGEKGNVWHLAGKKKNKSNSWKDLIFAGKYLTEEAYTSKEYLACEGTSAGGITVGMTANKSENVFGAILSNVGSNNATRTGRNPGGGLSEFGNPTKEEDFDALLKMDVFQNVKEGKAYTNMLFTGGMKDDRVDFWKPAKAAAKMQNCTSSNDRVAYIAYENLGHGGMGSSREEYLKYLADQFAFLEKVLK